MNKGRNIFLIMIVLLCVSVLAFFTLYERGNTSGVVDDVRYIVDSEQDGIKQITFYFTEKGAEKTCTATEDAEGVVFVIEECDYTYRYDFETKEVTSSPDNEDAFDVYTQKLFKTIVNGHKKFLKFWQAAIVGFICLCGGLIILYAEEIWLYIHRKEGREPAWSDMNGIKAAGGGVIVFGAAVMILFIVL